MSTITKSLTPTTFPSRVSCSPIPEIRWRPSFSQLECLRTYFKKQKYPTSEDKVSIVREMNEKFGSNLDTKQIGNWFQKERVKISEKPAKVANGVKIYRKFSQGEQNYLMESFDECKYPATESMAKAAEKLGVNLCKIENWYKHTRRAFAREGKITLPERKYYDLEGLSYLQNKFQENPRPSKAELLKIANNLHCDIAQVRNWFSNNKKKIKFLDKTSNTKRSLECMLEEKLTEAMVKSEESICLTSPPSQICFQPTINHLIKTSPSSPLLDLIPTDNITKKLNIFPNQANNTHDDIQYSNQNFLNRTNLPLSNTVQNPIQLNINVIQSLAIQQQLPLQYQNHIQIFPQTLNLVTQNPSPLFNNTSLQQRLYLGNLMQNLPKQNTPQDPQNLSLLNSIYLNNLAVARQLQLQNCSQQIKGSQQSYIAFVPVKINQQPYG